MTGKQQIIVDLWQLRETCATVRTDAERLRADLVEADARIQRGVWLGLRSPSGEVDAARRALLETLRVHAVNSGNQITAACQLSAALAAVIGEYISADKVVSLDVKDMEDLLERALPSRPTSGHWSEL